MKKLLLLTLTLTWHLPAMTDELYRWVDAEGNVHFGDRPPANTEATAMAKELRSLNLSDATKPGQYPDQRRAEQIERDYQAQKRRQQLQQLQQQKAVCQRARRELKILQGRVYFVDGHGNESTVSERERAAQARDLEAQIRQLCG